VFRKPPGFDSDNDPLVRVEAGRLRSRLCEYYATAGTRDVVRIELKPGSYVPTFHGAPEVSADAPPPALPEATWAAVPWFIGLAVGLVAAVATVAWVSGGLGFWRSTPGTGSVEEAAAATAPRILVQVFRRRRTCRSSYAGISRSVIPCSEIPPKHTKSRETPSTMVTAPQSR
jgi:hypothetical protein